MGKQMMILVYLNTTISRNIELIKLKYMRKTNKCYEAGHHVSIATKISPEYVDKLKFVAKSFDMSPYELLQCLLYSFLFLSRRQKKSPLPPPALNLLFFSYCRLRKSSQSLFDHSQILFHYINIRRSRFNVLRRDRLHRIDRKDLLVF